MADCIVDCMWLNEIELLEDGIIKLPWDVLKILTGLDKVHYQIPWIRAKWKTRDLNNNRRPRALKCKWIRTRDSLLRVQSCVCEEKSELDIGLLMRTDDWSSPLDADGRQRTLIHHLKWHFVKRWVFMARQLQIDLRVNTKRNSRGWAWMSDSACWAHGRLWWWINVLCNSAASDLTITFTINFSKYLKWNPMNRWRRHWFVEWFHPLDVCSQFIHGFCAINSAEISEWLRNWNWRREITYRRCLSQLKMFVACAVEAGLSVIYSCIFAFGSDAELAQLDTYVCDNVLAVPSQQTSRHW